MPLSSIAKMVRWRRDPDHDRPGQVFKVLSSEAAGLQYLAALPESQKVMLKLRNEGMTTSQIANRMAIERKSVARSLARIYGDLRVIHRHYEKEVAPA